MVMRVASFFPFQTAYYLNGHSFIKQELHRADRLPQDRQRLPRRRRRVAALQAAANQLSPQIIRKTARRLDPDPGA
jgi:hypothetical protein